MQCLVVDGGLLPIATLQNRFFAIEHIANEEGGAGYAILGDVNAVVFCIGSVIAHPGRAWVVVLVFFVRVIV